MPTVFITSTNRFGFAVGSSQNVTDAQAAELFATNSGRPGDNVLPAAQSPAWFRDLLAALSSQILVPRIYAFPDFSPSILASFVAGTTATQAGNLVTVTATAHGIVGSAAKNGYRIYYPGSPSIAAGWYSGFAWVDANTVTFTNPTAQTVASESVNGGLAMLQVITCASMILPGMSMGTKGRITARVMRGGDSTSSVKYVKLNLNGIAAALCAATTYPFGNANLSIFNRGTGSQSCALTNDGNSASGANSLAIDTSIDQPVAVSMLVSQASSYVCIDGLDLEVVKL